jgi:hypothetical protein
MPVFTETQAIAELRKQLQAIADGGVVDKDTLEELLTETAPENLATPYSKFQSKADRYDAIVRWFKNDLKYKMSVGEDEDLGVAIDDKIDEEQEAKAARRAARLAAGE